MTNRPDRLEYWADNRCIATVESSHQPVKGSMVNLHGVWYIVKGSNYGIDQLDNYQSAQSFYAVDLEKLV